MPHIRFRGVKAEDIKKISRELVDNLEKIIGCPREYFVLETVNSTFISDGEESDGYPFIEVAWFKRDQDVQDRTAKEITRTVKIFSDKTVDVAFVEFKEDCYYENGEHF